MTDSSLIRLDALGLDCGVSVDRVGKPSGEDVAEIVGWLAKEAGR
ncbi:hypothetical protein [Burkholderia sp.]|jgi:hypothetical protein|nr:hypothetical protein [Burkholderia sp.]